MSEAFRRESAIRPGAHAARRPGLKLHHRVALSFILFATLLTGAALTFVYLLAQQQVYSDIRQRLQDIASIAAATVDASLLDTLQDPSQEDSPEFLRFREELQHIRDASSDIKYIYTLRAKPDGGLYFVVDAESNPEDIAHFGQDYENPGPVLQKNFAGLDAPLVEEDFYTDAWGTWLSGYAPILRADGTRVAVLGVDIAADTVRTYRRRMFFLALTTFAIVALCTVPLGVWVGKRISRPIVAIKKGADRIADGDLQSRIHVARNDEIGSLAVSFNHMAASLKQGLDNIEEMAVKYRSIFDNALEGIFQITMDGVIITLNKAMANLLGYDSPEELLRIMDRKAAPIHASPEQRENLLRTLREQGQVRGWVLEFRRKDQSHIFVELHAHILREADGSEVIEGMVHDITERLAMEQAERERRAAEAASQAKSDFLANMSHEIRTPMNAVIGMTDLALKTELSAKQKDYLAKIKTASRSLLAIINDILDFSKIEAGKLAMEEVPFQLQQVMEHTTDMVGQRAVEKGVEFFTSIPENVPCSLVGDPLRLGQVCINLANNAVKFTEKGEVLVRVELDPEEGLAPESALSPGHVRLRIDVRDTGIGIAPDVLPTLFASFTQADGSITRKYGGTGLGLAITKRLVEMMGGTLRVGSELGKGSVFSVHLRLRRQAEEKPYFPPVHSDVKGLRVLVTDDNDSARQILVETLQSLRFKAKAVPDGDAALRELRRAPGDWDLLLVDWKMPGLDGVETVRRIQEELKDHELPLIIMVTAYGREEALERGKDLGINAFLDKPINPSHLFDTIMQVCSGELAQVGDAAASTPEPGREAEFAALLEGLTVLLVEDMAINRQVAREILEAAGCLVLEAENGLQALDALRKVSCDMVLMDVQMPEMDGYEATRRIRAASDLAAPNDVPVIAMTAHVLAADQKRCLDAGMNDHVPKPVEALELYATMAKWRPSTVSETPGEAPPQTGEAPGTDLPRPEKTVPDKEALGGVAGEPLPELPDELPGVDLRAGIKRVQGNTKLYLKLLKDFARDFSDYGQGLQQALDEQDTDAAGQKAHALKGVAGAIGAMELQSLAKDLEMACKNEHVDALPEALRPCLAELGKVIEGIDAHFAATSEASAAEAQTAAESQTPLDEEGEKAALALLAKLEKLLASNSFMAGQAVEDLRALLRGRANPSFEALRDAVGAFAFERARNELAALAETLGLEGKIQTPPKKGA